MKPILFVFISSLVGIATPFPFNDTDLWLRADPPAEGYVASSECLVAPFTITVLTEETFTLVKTPAFPKKYLDNVECGWAFTGPVNSKLHVTCPVVRLSGNDYLTFVDNGDKIEKTGDLNDMSFTYSGNTGSIELSTNDIKRNRGFVCSVSVIMPADCECGQMKTSRTAGDVELARVGGVDDEPPPNKLPWMVGLLDSFSKIYCAGVLINDRFVLTAASCIRDTFYVVLGQHYRELGYPYYPAIMRAPEAIKLHADYDSVTKYDNLALIEVDPINWEGNPLIRPICLPTDSSKTFLGETAIVAGWGLNGDLTQPLALRETSLQVDINEKCQTRYGPYYTVSPNQICTTPDPVEAYFSGDGGAPLVVYDGTKYELVGIVARDDLRWLYTRVTKYLTWIADNTVSGAFCAA